VPGKKRGPHPSFRGRTPVDCNRRARAIFASRCFSPISGFGRHFNRRRNRGMRFFLHQNTRQPGTMETQKPLTCLFPPPMRTTVFGWAPVSAYFFRRNQHVLRFSGIVIVNNHHQTPDADLRAPSTNHPHAVICDPALESNTHTTDGANFARNEPIRTQQNPTRTAMHTSVTASVATSNSFQVLCKVTQQCDNLIPHTRNYRQLSRQTTPTSNPSAQNEISPASLAYRKDELNTKDAVLTY